MAFYIVSFCGYFLLISNCITFRMKARYYFLLAGMIGAFIFVGIPLIGEISVVLMYLCVMVLLAILKREDTVWNILSLVFVYAISAILDNVVGAIFSMFGINLQQHMWLYALIVWPEFVLISRFISGKIRQIRQRASVVFPLRITVVLAANVILCMLIFIVQVLFERMVGSSSTLLWGNVLLFAAYFALTFFMVYVFVKEYSKNAEMKVKQQSYENLRIYMAQIEELYQQLRGFKHDYANIMASMASYIETEDLEGLKTYYEREILPVSVKISRGNDAVVKLHNLNILELKSLLSLKLNYALELNIEVALEITEQIDRVEMKTLDLVRVMGILLDNAIEACQECERPGLQIAVIRMEENVTFIIRNTYVQHDLDYSRLGTAGVSSKGEQRGIGLYNIRRILKEYENVFLDTECGDGFFTQTLQVCESKDDREEMEK